MDIFLKTAAGILISIILYLVLSRQGQDMAVLLSVTVCVMTIGAAIRFLSPIFQFMEKLAQIGNINYSVLKIMIKSSGIAFLAEIITLICNDSGNSAFGKSVQFLASAVILWLSIPILDELVSLLDKILGYI